MPSSKARASGIECPTIFDIPYNDVSELNLAHEKNSLDLATPRVREWSWFGVKAMWELCVGTRCGLVGYIKRLA